MSFFGHKKSPHGEEDRSINLAEYEVAAPPLTEELAMRQQKEKSRKKYGYDSPIASESELTYIDTDSDTLSRI